MNRQRPSGALDLVDGDGRDTDNERGRYGFYGGMQNTLDFGRMMR
ncbi:MAG: hypothetical protein QME66_11790 [Candidatus Eisenbacteria bacterium]|nr:hypothetical protein [Candidatus Eisenbacteria bacterium]